MELAGVFSVEIFQGLAKVVVFAKADNRIKLGDLLAQLFAVALPEAAGDDDLLPGCRILLELTGLEDRVDRLFLRRFHEAAGVDHDDIGVFGFRSQDKTFLA